jgi:hypothetical protein
VADIASSSREQASGIEQLNNAITMMDDVTQQNAALMEEASAAAQALTEQASSLTQLIDRYRVGEGSSDEAPRAASPPAPTHAAAPAVERRAASRPNFNLEFLDLHRHGRRGELHLFRGANEAQMFGDRGEDAKLAKGSVLH